MWFGNFFQLWKDNFRWPEYQFSDKGSELKGQKVTWWFFLTSAKDSRIAGPGADRSESIQDFQNMVGPGPIRDFEVFLSTGPVQSKV